MSNSRAKDIFLDAIDVPPEGQADFLRSACGEDDALRRQVEALLRAYRSRPGMLDGPAADLVPPWTGASASKTARPGPAVDTLSARHRSERPGDVIDRYRLVRVLGEGGFGSVFLAQQTSPVVRDVALKVIRRGMDTDQIIARFELERQALAMMDHPGIARVLDAGATASGRPYFVMEYVDGVPITQYCEQHQLTVRQRLELIQQASLAVQHAHQKGIIHRDLKPGNILVTRFDDRAIPKIIDFGVAKATDPGAVGASGAPAMTLEAQIIGTPQYMSPEQATGGIGKIDTRTDVYSLGTVLYELITGAAPFDPESLRRAGVEGLGRIIRDETPARPSSRIWQSGRQKTIEDRRMQSDDPTLQSALDTRQSIPAFRRPRSRPWATGLRRKLAGEIDWIVMKCLEKDPARRYQSPAELAADIRRHLSDQAVLAGPPSRLYTLQKFARRHRAAIAAVAVVAVTLVATAVASALLAARARRAELDALRQAQRAQEELSRANAIVAFTGDLLGGIAPGRARGRDTALLRELLDDSIRKADAELAGQPSADLAVRNIIAGALNDLGDGTAALGQLRSAYAATAGTSLHDHPERLRAAVTIAEILLGRFEVPEAEQFVNEALAGYRRAGMEGSDEAYVARLAQAGVYMRSHRIADAEQLFAAILAHYRDAGRGESRPAILAWNNLALAMAGQDRWEEASEQWRQLNAVDRRVYGEDHPYTLMTLVSLASSLTHQKRFAEAEASLREAMSIGRRVFDPGHPTLLSTMNNLGAMLIDLNKLDEADAVLTEALETGRRKLGPMDPPMDTIVLHLGVLRAKQGRPDEAVKYAYELHGAVAAKFGERDPKTISSLVLVFDNLLAANRAAEGVAIIEKLGDFPAELDPALLQRLHACAGLLYFAVGDEPAARRHAEQARAASPKGPDGEPRITGSLRVLEARLRAEDKSPLQRAD